MFKVLAVMLVSASVVLAGGGANRGDFLLIGVGERACSMAGAFTGVSDDPTAVYWNPAGAVQMASREMTLGHTDYVADIKVANAAYIVPMGKYVVGVGLENLYVEDWRRDEDGNVLGTFVNNNTMIGAMLAYKVSPLLSVGGVLKGVHEQLDTERASAVAIDLGVMYDLGGISLGMVVKNLGTPMGYGDASASLPTDIRVGIGYAGLASGRGMISSDINMPVNGKRSVVVGGEYNVYRTLYVRGGYKLQEGGSDLGGLDGLNMGLGFAVRSVKVNYGMQPWGEFGIIHRISMGTSF